MGSRKWEFLQPIRLSDLAWVYADDKRIQIVVRWPENTQTFTVTQKRLDRLRKQAEAARASGEYKP